MIVELDGFPDDVVAVRAQGQVTGEDYSRTLVPAVDKRLATCDRIRLLYQIGPDFKRFTTTALWEDARVGLHHLHDFERVAVVTDVDWIGRLIDGIAGSMPGSVKHFTLDATDEASRWITERNSDA
jgi:hypothetical protein